MKVTAIVPAAGTGERMQCGVKKPYIELCCRPILSYTLQVVGKDPSIDRIVVPVYPGEEECCRKQIVAPLDLAAEVIIIAGGRVRQESVSKALVHVSSSCDEVLIHDGARPLVTDDLIARAISETHTKQATTLGVPVKDSITRASHEHGTIIETLNRNGLFAVQTPQTFLRDIIMEAHRAAAQDGFAGTDDASLVERIGIPVTILPGAYTNIKITTFEDLLFAEAVLAGRNAVAG